MMMMVVVGIIQIQPKQHVNHAWLVKSEHAMKNRESVHKRGRKRDGNKKQEVGDTGFFYHTVTPSMSHQQMMTSIYEGILSCHEDHIISSHACTIISHGGNDSIRGTRAAMVITTTRHQ